MNNRKKEIMNDLVQSLAQAEASFDKREELQRDIVKAYSRKYGPAIVMDTLGLSIARYNELTQ